MAALNFEHAWGDGVAVMRYFNEVAKDGQKNAFVGQGSKPADIDPTKYVRRLGEWCTLGWHIARRDECQRLSQTGH